MIQCPFCKNEHPDDAQFCPVTGSAIPQPSAPKIAEAPLVCKNCKTSLPTEAQFCPVCGEVITNAEHYENGGRKTRKPGKRFYTYLAGFCFILLLSTLVIISINQGWLGVHPIQQLTSASTHTYLTEQPTDSEISTPIVSTSTHSPSSTIVSAPVLASTTTSTSMPTISVVILSCPDALPTRHQIGQHAEVTTSGKAWQLSLRSAPSLNAAQVHVIAAGRALVILDGPICAEGSYWWYIRSEQGFEGWSREGDSEDYWIDPLP